MAKYGLTGDSYFSGQNSKSPVTENYREKLTRFLRKFTIKKPFTFKKGLRDKRGGCREGERLHNISAESSRESRLGLRPHDKRRDLGFYEY